MRTLIGLFFVFNVLFFTTIQAQFTKFSDTKFSNTDTIKDVYKNLYGEISAEPFTGSFVQTVIERVCQHGQSQCTPELFIETKNLHEFEKKILKTQSLSTSKALDYSSYLHKTIQEEVALLSWELALTRLGVSRLLFVNNDDPKQNNKTRVYQEKDSIFDVLITLDRLEKILFSEPYSTLWNPLFFKKDTLREPNAEKNADVFVHPENTTITLPDALKNPSILSQIQRINIKIFKEKLNQVPLKCIRNAKAMLQTTSCDKEPIPNVLPNAFQVPGKSADIPVSEKTLPAYFYIDTLRVIEQAQSCFEEYAFEKNIRIKNQKIASCEFERQFLWTDGIRSHYTETMVKKQKQNLLDTTNETMSTKYLTSFLELIIENLTKKTDILLKKPKK